MFSTKLRIIQAKTSGTDGKLSTYFLYIYTAGQVNAETLKFTVMEKNDLVVLMTFTRVNNASMHKALLESAGIKAYVLDEYMGTVFPVGGDLQVRLAVAKEDEAKAREILAADFDKAGFKEDSKNMKE